MYKVYLAVGNEGVEKYIKSQKPLLEKMLNDTVNFVGATVYKEGALQGVKDYHPDVIILREGLHGSLDILDLVYKIRLESSNTRIIFITKTREVGDAFLATSVQLGVYDLIIGDKISVKDLLKKIVYPTKFIDVAHYIPKVTVDEKTNKKIFSAPDVDALVKQRVEEIAVPVMQEQQMVNENKTAPIQIDTSKDEPPINILKDTEDSKVIVKEVDNGLEPELVATYTDPSITPIAPVSIENSLSGLNFQKENMQETSAPIVVQPVNEDLEDDFSELPPTIAPIAISTEKIETQPETYIPQTPIVDINKNEPTGFNPNFNTEKNNVNENIPPIHTMPEVPPVVPVVPVIPVVPTVEPQEQSYSAPVSQPMQEAEAPKNIGDIRPIQPIDGIPIPTQNPYTVGSNPSQTINDITSKKGFTLFKKKSNQKTIPAQIITFWGGSNGVGNSQIAFNTAIALANKGYHVIYVDLNEHFSAVESMMQLGFEDLGIDTMLNNIENNRTDKVGHAIGSVAKILPFTDKRDFLYKTYTNMPSSLNFAFFSQHCFEGRTGVHYDIERLKDLNLMFLMDFGYDVIILDAPADVKNRATQLALAYANKVFVTLNQDKTVLSRTLKQMKYLSYNRINVRDKSYFVINRFENCDFSYNNLSNFIAMNLQYERLEMLSIPNLSKEFINSIYNGMPVILSTKNKELLKTINDVVALIES